MKITGMLTSNSCEWETPDDLYKIYDEQYHFTLDPCSTDENAKCAKHYTIAQDGLKQNWEGETVWCNPPYGKQASSKWVKKGYEESKKPGTTVVMLLPTRTDTRWFHEYCLRGEIQFIKGRVRFGNAKSKAPFPSMIVIFKEEKK